MQWSVQFIRWNPADESSSAFLDMCTKFYHWQLGQRGTLHHAYMESRADCESIQFAQVGSQTID